MIDSKVFYNVVVLIPYFSDNNFWKRLVWQTVYMIYDKQTNKNKLLFNKLTNKHTITDMATFSVRRCIFNIYRSVKAKIMVRITAVTLFFTIEDSSGQNTVFACFEFSWVFLSGFINFKKEKREDVEETIVNRYYNKW